MAKEEYVRMSKHLSRLSDAEVKAQGDSAPEGSARRDLAQETLGLRKEANKQSR